MSRHLRPISGLLPLLLAACAASPAEKNAITSEWGDCIMQAVMRLDDGKSDPASVAYGISPQCAVQYNRFTEMMVADNITQRGQAAARAEMRAEEIRLITSAVLTYRAAHKK